MVFENNKAHIFRFLLQQTFRKWIAGLKIIGRGENQGHQYGVVITKRL